MSTFFLTADTDGTRPRPRVGCLLLDVRHATMQLAVAVTSTTRERNLEVRIPNICATKYCTDFIDFFTNLAPCPKLLSKVAPLKKIVKNSPGGMTRQLRANSAGGKLPSANSIGGK